MAQKRVHEDDWANDSWNDVIANAPSPKRVCTEDWGMNDAQFAGYVADLPEEVFEDKPVKMDFNKLLKLKLVREKYIKKFGIKQQ